MKKLSIILLVITLAGAGTTYAQSMSMTDVTKSFNKIKGDYDKFMKKVKPFQDAVTKNMDKLPSDVQSKYKSFNDELTKYESSISSFDPMKMTDPTAATAEVNKLESGLKDLNTQYKSLSSEVKKAGIKI